MSATASSSNLVGFTLEGRYKILREVGRGGMGIVYEAENTDLGKRVAIKLMLDKYTDDAEAVSRFKREAFAASTIGNSHIINVSHIGKAPDGRPFVVMELLVGLPLSQVIEMTGPMAHWRAIAIMRQVLRAVGAAHAKGIVHRDLKPDNIFLVEQDDQRDFVKLLDFGISKMMDGTSAVAHTKLTSTGMVMGTPLYMAPEQAMGTSIDHHADIYACGVILYEMLSGRPPFEGATFAVLIAKLLTAEPTPILEKVPGLPARLVSAVHRALEKDPEKRWPSCEAFYSALPIPSTPSQMEFAGTLGVGPTSLQIERVALPTAPNLARTRRNGLWIALAAAAGVAVAGTVVVVATRHAPSSPGTTAPAPGVAAAATTPTPVQPTPQPAGSAATMPAPPPAQTQTTGTLHVKTEPPGASILIDNLPSGVTPGQIVLMPGTHKIHVELAKFVAFDDEVTIAVGEQTSLNVPLVAMQAGRPHGPPPRVGATQTHTPITNVPTGVAPPQTNAGVSNTGIPNTLVDPYGDGTAKPPPHVPVTIPTPPPPPPPTTKPNPYQ